MSLIELNPIVFTVSLFSGYLLWIFIKMTLKTTTLNKSQIGKWIVEWWSVRKITKWKNLNKTNDYSDDGLDNKYLKFFGCNQNGEALFVEFLNSHGVTDANFTLRLKDGAYLTIPIELEHPRTSLIDSKREIFSSRGLTIERITPYTKWRITYNGLSYIKKPPNGNENIDTEPQHVILTFFWTAASDPLSWPNNWSAKLLYRAFENVDDAGTHLNELLTSDEGFDQYGTLFGQVVIHNRDSRDTYEMNLPGVRMNRHLKRNIDTFPPTKCHLMAACKDGFVVSLSARNVNNAKKIYSGSVRMPNMDVHCVGDLSLNVLDFETGNALQTISFDINAHKKFTATVRITPDSSQSIRNAGYQITKTPFSIDVEGQSGMGFIISSKKISNPHSDRESIKPNPLKNLKPRNVWKLETLTLFFNEPDAQSEQLCGGKGSSLALLTQLANNSAAGGAAFIVPQGFTLTTDAFDIQLKYNYQLRNAISDIENIAYNRTAGTMEDACEKVSKLFLETPMHDKVADEVRNAFSILVSNTTSSIKVAVRSSAIGEDGAESSSAGQNETFLGVQHIDDVFAAVQKCWASLFTAQSVTYRIQNIQPINTKMAVVVQVMVAADCAGVLFTQHPVTNDPSKLLVTANYGLGESVVSGTVDPDMFTIQRSYRNNNLNILEKKVGGKESVTIMTSKSAGVNNSKIGVALRNQLCLTDESLLKLCEIGIYLEESFGTPRDIEWAIHQGKFYLLQSRPMTSLKSFSAWELLHEFDTAVMSEEEYFTFGNVGEVMPEAMTPLTASVLIPSFEKGLLKNTPIKMGNPKFFNQIVATSHSRLSIDVFSVMLRVVKPTITIENRVHALTIFGHEFLTEKIHQMAIHRYGTVSKLIEMLQLCYVVRYGFVGKSEVEKLNRFMEQFVGSCNRRNLRVFRTLKELYDYVTVKIGHDFIYVQSIHGLSSMMSSIYQIILFSALAEGKHEFSAEYLNDMTTLLSSCKNAESAEITILLGEIAAALLRCNSAKAHEFCDIAPEMGIAWLADNCITTYTLFEAFIAKNAHRGYQEFDFGYETWGMNPALVIEMLQKIVRNWDSKSPRRERAPKRSNEELLAELKTPSKSSTMRTIKFILPRCQTFVELRERTKSHLIAYVHELRKAYCYLAERMQKEGVLPDMDLIFYLTHQEIGIILDDRSRSDLISKAIRRRRFFPEWKKLRFDEFQWGVMKPQSNDVDIRAMDGSLKVVGTPVCEGKMTGRACVVKSFAEVSKIRAGDILVTHGTDVAWSPYFPTLSGVVTELGGLISHGAVVAREYGLPCIVGATNATAIITDGEDIYMDATAGIIMKLGTKNGIKP